MAEGHSRYRQYTDDKLVDEAGSSSRTEMTRRLKDAIEASERSSTALGRRIGWLNVWLLVFTIAICVLTGLLAAEAFGWLRAVGHR